MGRWRKKIFVHGKGCKAEETRQRTDCTCNLRKKEYDAAWVFRKHYKPWPLTSKDDAARSGDAK